MTRVVHMGENEEAKDRYGVIWDIPTADSCQDLTLAYNCPHADGAMNTVRWTACWSGLGT